MALSVFLNEATFSSGTTLTFDEGEIVVFVGPNNAGKSEALRSIYQQMQNPGGNSPVVTEIKVQKVGTTKEVEDWFKKTCRSTFQSGNLHFEKKNVSLPWQALSSHWQNLEGHLGTCADYFRHFLTTDERLQSVKAPRSFPVVDSAPQHPIQYLYSNDELELKISRLFRQAFGTDIIVNRDGGSQIPLHMGERPKLMDGEHRGAHRYVTEVTKLPLVDGQGDGIRSFLGCLLHATVVEHFVVLIDEPEAFLHPPQARLMGRMLATEKPAKRQLILATHSGDVLKGLLDRRDANVRVVRIQREGNENRINELNTEEVSQLWNDPLHRYSNVLDGLFHERVVLCESDSDCQFYAAINDSYYDHDDTAKRPDVMFSYSNGKNRMPVVVRALRSLQVNIRVVVDFDALNSEHPLRALFEGLGGKWENVRTDWNVVKSAVENKKPQLESQIVKTEVQAILDGVFETEMTFPDPAAKEIQKILKKATPWGEAKNSGKAFLPRGDASAAFQRLMSACNERGLFIVEVGEVEQFCKSVGHKGPKWVNEVLKKDLFNDPELQEARDFVKRVIPPEEKKPENAPATPGSPATLPC